MPLIPVCCELGTAWEAPEALGAAGAGEGGTTECSVPITGLLHPGPGVDGKFREAGARCGGGGVHGRSGLLLSLQTDEIREGLSTYIMVK